MKYQIELSAFKGRIWVNSLLWLNDSNARVETRIAEVNE